MYHFPLYYVYLFNYYYSLNTLIITYYLHYSTQGIYFGRGNLAKNLRNFLLKTTNFIGLPLEK